MSPWTQPGQPAAPGAKFARPQYDADQVVDRAGRDGVPVYLHCGRCGATWTRGAWEHEERGGVRRPIYEGGAFYVAGGKLGTGSTAFRCRCQAALQNYRNLPEAPSWLVQMWVAQGRPRVVQLPAKEATDEP